MSYLGFTPLLGRVLTTLFDANVLLESAGALSSLVAFVTSVFNVYAELSFVSGVIRPNSLCLNLLAGSGRLGLVVV